jgi:enamine deaminase RidA (YjgF/YER057c/UK114 family)
MGTYSNPPTVAGPFGMYSQMCAVPANARWLAVAGQIGADAAGNTPEDVEAQCRNAFANVRAVLAAGGMAPEDIVQMRVYLCDRGDIPAYRAAREAMMGEVKPPNTLLIVSSLASPAWKVEIDALAARAEVVV